MQPMRIALLQLNFTVGDLAGNAVRLEEATREAARRGAELAVAPELALFGYPPRDLLLDGARVAEAAAVADDLARRLAGVVPLLVGTVLARPGAAGRPLANAAVLIEGGLCRPVARKMLLPTYDVFDEDRYFEPAEAPGVLTLAGRRLGITICEDAWNDSEFWPRPRYHRDPVAELAAHGVEWIINLSSSPFVRGKQREREAMLAHAARRHRLGVLYVNPVGGNDELIFDGRSSAFAADGTLAARARAFQEDILLVDCDGGTGRIEPSPAEEEEVWQALVVGTRDYARKCGFRQGLVALSGGIDSALTTAVVAEALGAANVLAVMMPSPYSSAGSIDDSLALATELGVETLKLPIAPAMAAFGEILAPPFAGLAQDVTEENLQARIRGTLVMALSNKLNRLVFTTGNKSEAAVGYSTLYGDTAGALAVIGDLFKTEVYALARWLGRIPGAILTKAPSAELRPGQRDQDTLPPYELLDAVLRLHIEQSLGIDAIAAHGFEQALVEQVVHMVRLAEFKRRQAPPVLKVSACAFGMGWQMPIARR